MSRRLYTRLSCVDTGNESLGVVDIFNTDEGVSTKEAFKTAKLATPLKSGVYKIVGPVAGCQADGEDGYFTRNELNIENQYLVYDSKSHYLDVIPAADLERLRGL